MPDYSLNTCEACLIAQSLLQKNSLIPRLNRSPCGFYLGRYLRETHVTEFLEFVVSWCRKSPSFCRSREWRGFAVYITWQTREGLTTWYLRWQRLLLYCFVQLQKGDPSLCKHGVQLGVAQFVCHELNVKEH